MTSTSGQNSFSSHALPKPIPKQPPTFHSKPQKPEYAKARPGERKKRKQLEKTKQTSTETFCLSARAPLPPPPLFFSDLALSLPRFSQRIARILRLTTTGCTELLPYQGIGWQEEDHDDGKKEKIKRSRCRFWFRLSIFFSRFPLSQLAHRSPPPLFFPFRLPRSSQKKKIEPNQKVSTKDYPRFIESYGTILKAHMDGLRKRERVRGAAGKAGGKK